MNAFPKINKNLEEISKIPAALEKLAKKIEQSNDNVVKQVQLKLNTLSMSGASHEETSARVLSPGMKLLIWVVGIVIIFASLFISVMSFKSWQNTRTIQQKLLEDNTTEVIDSVEASPVKVDSTAIKAKPEKPDTAQVFQ
jgi:Na+-transporting methylmalonyl-CoA/oxaloacetate decarboxylase gamma subunit